MRSATAVVPRWLKALPRTRARSRQVKEKSYSLRTSTAAARSSVSISASSRVGVAVGPAAPDPARPPARRAPASAAACPRSGAGRCRSPARPRREARRFRCRWWVRRSCPSLRCAEGAAHWVGAGEACRVGEPCTNGPPTTAGLSSAEARCIADRAIGSNNDGVVRDAGLLAEEPVGGSGVAIGVEE